ncbi:MAG: hypothetical protein K2J82_07600 [Muribaculaceae bacterium]|nr:hypothetical protein [Muribaculaceae bacterium]MDE6754461.1 hypothetical protein [Muribaculaceae bacterium]
MKLTLEELEAMRTEAYQDLKELEGEYIGGNEIQQKILLQLKDINLTYKWNKDILKAKIAYIDALIIKLKNDPYSSGLIEW